MSSHKSIIGIMAMAAMPAVVCAQTLPGAYVGGALGLDVPRQQTINGSSLADSPLTINWSSEATGLVAAGYRLGNGLRVELEVSHRTSTIESIVGTDVANVAGGSRRTDALMLNGLFDFDSGQPWIKPYLGAGIGYARTELSDYSLSPADARAFGMRASGGSNQFAYQAIAGASFPIGGVPGLSFTAELRFMATLRDDSFDGYRINPKGLRTDSYLSLGPQRQATALLGLRYEFGAGADTK